MRYDEAGNPCPGTLGEYRDAIAAIVGVTNKAIWLLDQQIAEQGRDTVVIASDERMCAALVPLAFDPVPGEPAGEAALRLASWITQISRGGGA